ncbi:AAA family ATPase [Kitasatospora albolonga]|uniref:AAA family ATPase n=1 Tax=Kitasatospora albolonga TaxID=68173 RepID=UPI0031EFB9BB
MSASRRRLDLGDARFTCWRAGHCADRWTCRPGQDPAGPLLRHRALWPGLPVAIQFTPDLLPSDVSGAPFYDQSSGEDGLPAGPVFTHLLLADEINARPRRPRPRCWRRHGRAQVSVDGG